MGTLFIWSVDTSGHHQDAEYLHSYMLIEETIQLIDRWEEIVQVGTDNAANFKAAGMILLEKKPHIVCVQCAAHCVDLMLEDIGKLEDNKKTIEGKMIASMIYNHQFMTYLLRELNQGHDLLRPGITRFTTHFVALERLWLQGQSNAGFHEYSISELKLSPPALVTFITNYSCHRFPV